MSGFGNNPITIAQGALPTNQLPISTVAVPNKANGDLTAVKGGHEITDSNSNVLAGVAVYTYDGENETLGAKTDTAATSGTGSWSALALLKGILTKLLGTIAVTGTFWQTTQPVSGTVGVSSLPVLPTGSNTIGGVNVVDSAGTNKQTINSAGQAQVEDIEQANYVAGSTPPTATNAGSDTTYTFSSQINRIIVQNNTSANVNIAFDTAASSGSLMIVPGALLVYPKKCTAFHIFTAAAQNINGTTAGNIVVLGAL